MTHKAKLKSTAEYMNTKYAEDQFVNIVKSQKQSTKYEFNKTTVKLAEELNQLNENSDTKNGRHSTHKRKIRRVLEEKMW